MPRYAGVESSSDFIGTDSSAAFFAPLRDDELGSWHSSCASCSSSSVAFFALRDCDLATIAGSDS